MPHICDTLKKLDATGSIQGELTWNVMQDLAKGTTSSGSATSTAGQYYTAVATPVAGDDSYSTWTAQEISPGGLAGIIVGSVVSFVVVVIAVSWCYISRPWRQSARAGTISKGQQRNELPLGRHHVRTELPAPTYISELPAGEVVREQEEEQEQKSQAEETHSSESTAHDEGMDEISPMSVGNGDNVQSASGAISQRKPGIIVKEV